MIKSDPRPRGRPRQFDRETALAAALDLFWRRGYEGVGVAELAAAMGLSVQSLYGAFGAKAGLYEAALELYQASHGAFAAEALRDGETAYAAVRNLLQQAAVRYEQGVHPGGCLVSTGLLTCAEDNTGVAETLRGMRLEARAAIAARIEAGRQAGEVPYDTDVEALAGLIAATIQGLSVQARDGASADDLGGVVKVALEAWPRPQAV